MRLEEIYFICDGQYKILEKVARDYHRSVNERRVSEITFQHYMRTLQQSLSELEKIDAFKRDIKVIQDISKSSRMQQCLTNLRVDVHEELLEKILILHKEVSVVTAICESLGYKKINEEEHVFSVKVPQNSELVDFSKIVSEFNFILNQCPVLQHEESKINLRKVDIGSVWLDFIIVGSAASVLLNNLAAFVDKCIAIWSHKKTCEQQIEQLKKMKLDNSLLEDLIETHKAVAKSLKNGITKELSTNELNSEDISRMEVCIDKMTVLFDKGLEVHAAIEQKDVQPLFPVAEEWKQLQGKKIELLEDTNYKDSE